MRYGSGRWPARIGLVRSRAVAYLEPNLAAVIHHLKYRRRRRVARPLGRWMARVALSDPDFRSCQGLVPVPLRPEKIRERGYNPAALLAGVVGAEMGIPVVAGALVKTRPTRSQTELTPSERMEGPWGSFGVRRPDLVLGRRLVLIDDVLTSGSTAAAAAAALLESGAGGVRVLTAARTPVARPAGKT